VRELKNMIERALIESGGKPIEPKHLRMIENAPRRISVSGTTPDAETILPLNLDAAEQVLIQRALQETDGNVMEAARLLGVNRSRIYRRFRSSQ
jgi:DNA-binding NtrC family response regulator